MSARNWGARRTQGSESELGTRLLKRGIVPPVKQMALKCRHSQRSSGSPGQRPTSFMIGERQKADGTENKY